MNKIYILSEIGGWGFWASDMQYFLQQNRGKDVEVYINSPGGYIDEGVAIYNMLLAHDGKVTTIVIGAAASMASIVFLAGEVRIQSAGSYVMIHEPGFQAISGNSEELQHAAAELDTMLEGMMEIYTARTGQASEVLEPLVKAETWMLGDQSLELGFATELKDADLAAVASTVHHNLSKFNNTPQALQRVSKPKAEHTTGKGPQATTKPKTKGPGMELKKATAADVEKENPQLFTDIAKAATEKEQARVAGLEGLAAHVEGAPEAVQLAAKAQIAKLRTNPTATAENSAIAMVGIVAKAQLEVATSVGAGARALGAKTENTPAGEDHDPKAEEEQTRANRVNGMAKAYAKKR